MSARPAPRASGEVALLAVLGAATTAFSLMQSLVIPALPEVQRSLDASPAQTSWLVTGFLIVVGVATPIAGRFGDMFGKRRVLVAVLAIVSAGTLMCAAGRSLEWLIAGRAVQGVGGGVLPLAFAIVRDELSPARVPRGLAMVSALLGLGGGLGVLLAGVVVQELSFTWLFWAQLPAFVAVAWLVHRHVPDSAGTSPGRIDWLGAALMSGGLVILLVTITQARTWGPSTTLACAAAAALVLGAWVGSALRRPDPLIDLRLMRRRPVWSANVAAFLFGIAQFSSFILVPQYVQEPESTGYGFGASTLASGIFLLPMTVTVLLVGPAIGPLERRFGAKSLLVAGNVILGGGLALLTFARSEPWEVYASSGLIGVATGLLFSSLATLVLAGVRSDQTGVATGANNVMRAVGGAVGGQLAAVFLAASAGVDGLPTASGYTLAFAVGLLAMAVAVALAPLMPGAAGSRRALRGLSLERAPR